MTTKEIKHKRGLALLESYAEARERWAGRTASDERWWRERFDAPAGDLHESADSQWLFNVILNKHADLMDAYPAPTVLPREAGDEELCRKLSAILPVILDKCRFRQTYSDMAWEKLKHGTSAVGVFWNPRQRGGGDVEIRRIDLPKLFWEPGITRLEDSANLFLAELWDRETLAETFGYREDKNEGTISAIPFLASYRYGYGAPGEPSDFGDKIPVFDWYYKTQKVAPDGTSSGTILHYVKMTERGILYDSDDDREMAVRGFYDHGQYPVVLDTLFPTLVSPVGFGMIRVCQGPQTYIDKLSHNLLESSAMGTKRRFFASESTAVNEDEFLDWNKPIVHVQGEISDARLKEITVEAPNDVYLDVMKMKIDEMKTTAANRDINAGGVEGNVTAASAIAALQETGNKVSRDMIESGYMAVSRMLELVIGLLWQFYPEERVVRVVGRSNRPAKAEFVGLKMGESNRYTAGETPLLDIQISPQKPTAYAKEEQNNLAKAMFQAGFFDKECRESAKLCLEMMDFDGADKLADMWRDDDTKNAGHKEKTSRQYADGGPRI